MEISANTSSRNSTSSATELDDIYPAGKDCMVVWRNLTVEVTRKVSEGKWWKTTRKEQQIILNEVNGYCSSGVFTAIMGSSGAGKTTLLATVSQRAKMCRSGEILVNGRELSRELMAKLSGFVPQHDLVYKSLTVTEHMEFMARLMMDQRTRRIHRNRRIYCLLSDLGLLRCCKTPLGQLSGGELKRLSLAVQLLTDPPILFCDEPTTGLDSYSAGVVLEHLRQCAERGKAVLATVHQPASGHFELFHEVLLLAGGRVAYSGPAGDALSYFNSVGLVCPPSYNPAEFYVQQLAVLPGKEFECLNKNQWICEQFASSDRGRALDEKIMNELNRHSSNEPSGGGGGLVKGNWSTHSSTTSESFFDDTDLETERKFNTHLNIIKPSCLTQLHWLSLRSFKDMKRNCADIILRFFFLMVIAALISTPFIGVTDDITQKTIQNMQGLMYLIITEVVFTFSYSVFHIFPGELPILLRELANGLYNPGPYYLSKMFIIFCRTFVEAILYATFIFWVVGLDGGSSGLFFFTLPILMASLSATAYGLLMSAAFESVATASLVSVPIELLGVMFSGLYLQLAGLSSYVSWIKYLSQFYYGQEAVSITQWHFVDHIDCYDDPALPCIANGAGALNKYGFDVNNYSTDLLGLGSIYCGANILGFIMLWFRSRKSAVY